MTDSSIRLPALLLVTLGVGCGETHSPTEPTSALPVVPAEWMEKEEPPAALKTTSPAEAPEATRPSRALLVGDEVVACFLDTKILPGAACPLGSSMGLAVMTPGAQHLSRQPVAIGAGACGHGAVTARTEPLQRTEAPPLEVLSTDATRYRDLIGPAVGVPRPADSPGFSLDQLLRIDLDGDGVQEVVFSAQGQLGVRRVVGDTAETVLLPTVGEAGIPTLLGVVDLEGDGSLELVAWSGDSLPGLGTQWVGHWVIGGLESGQTPQVLAQAGCEQEAPPRPAHAD